MHFSDQFLDEVVARNDIADVVSSYVTLTRKGGNLFGLCPFHNEKTPSFSVAPDKQIYHCFGCKKGGGVINFIMEIEGLSFPEAVEFLAKRANIPLPAEDEARSNADRLRRRVLELNRAAARWYYDQLQLPQGAAVQAYLDKRQIRRGIAVRFGMGASLDQWDALLRAMTDKGFTKQELLASGLVVNGKNGGLYDKFRNRLMLPVVTVALNAVEPARVFAGEEVVFSFDVTGGSASNDLISVGADCTTAEKVAVGTAMVLPAGVSTVCYWFNGLIVRQLAVTGVDVEMIADPLYMLSREEFEVTINSSQISNDMPVLMQYAEGDVRMYAVENSKAVILPGYGGDFELYLYYSQVNSNKESFTLEFTITDISLEFQYEAPSLARFEALQGYHGLHRSAGVDLFEECHCEYCGSDRKHCGIEHVSLS